MPARVEYTLLTTLISPRELEPSLQNTSNSAARAQGRGKKRPEDLVRDFLSQLGDHLQYILLEKLGAAVVNSIPFEFVITVPAIWSDLAKDKTRLACIQADGLPVSEKNIHLISEPEAAATYAIHGLDPHGLKIGDTILVVDAGGGTVDLISYTIAQLKPVLEVKEATPGTGGLCGSTLLNMRFKNFLVAQLGRQKGFDDELLSEVTEVFEKKVTSHSQVPRDRN